jgi:uncharacterized protein
MNLDEKYAKLRDILRGLGSATVAFSGGVDSSFLCKAAREALGDRSLAVTVVSPMLPRSEIDCAKEVAAAVGSRHVLIEDPDIEEHVAANPADRCYHCKKIEFSLIAKAARENGAEYVIDGSNLDDPLRLPAGLRALEELGVRSPLREAGLTKADIRELSRRLGLPTWDKPAFACLASRIPTANASRPKSSVPSSVPRTFSVPSASANSACEATGKSRESRSLPMSAPRRSIPF